MDMPRPRLIRTGRVCRERDFSFTARRFGHAGGQVQGVSYHRCMADEHAQPLEQQLEEMRAQLAWVRDYL